MRLPSGAAGPFALMSEPAGIALVQTTSTDDFAANAARAEFLLERAAGDGARLVAFPEVVFLMAGRARKLECAEALDGPTVSRFRELAAAHRIMVLIGSMHERIEGDGARVHNTSVLIGADGVLLAVYRKRKLFDLDLPELRIRESDAIRPGEDPPPVVETPIGRIGLTICFDLRFSELYAGLAGRGAELIFVPSNFTVPTGAAHWEVLLRARAIETQCYVAAPAQWGRHTPRYTSYGHSMMVDPWGRVTACLPEGNGLIHAPLDLALLRKVRRELPMGRGVEPASAEAPTGVAGAPKGAAVAAGGVAAAAD